MKFPKMSAFNLTVLVGISLFWEVFFTFRVLISLITSLELVYLKVKFVSKLFLYICNTRVIFKKSERFFEGIICVINLIVWNIRNFKVINYFWEKIIKKLVTVHRRLKLIYSPLSNLFSRFLRICWKRVERQFSKTFSFQ